MELGRLEKVDIRSVWAHEANDFTPWLAQEENIALLSDEIGIELEFLSREEGVGPFSADLLCQDINTNRRIIIENQFDAKTDHKHLGQILTYAAGLDAFTMIWIAPAFTEEHRAALDWLNRVTNEEINFFGIEIELYRIGGSQPAPKFHIIAKPNNWSKRARNTVEPGTITPTKQLQLEYWQSLKEAIDGTKSVLKTQKPLAQHWYNFSLGRSNFNMAAFANTRDARIGVMIQLYGPDAKSNFAKLKEKFGAEAEGIFGEKLEWRPLPEGKESQIILSFDANPKSKSDWAGQHKLLKETLERLYRFFAPKIREL